MPYYNAADMWTTGNDAWHTEWVSKSGLKARIWTDIAIEELLPPPQKAGPILAWLLKDVLAAGFRAWMEKRRAWLDAHCRLPDIAYATYGPLAIGWNIGASDMSARYQKLVWNEDRQDLTDLPRYLNSSPFTGAGHQMKWPAPSAGGLSAITG